MAETRAGESSRNSRQPSIESSMRISAAIREPGKDSYTESSSYGNTEEDEQDGRPTVSLDDIEYRYFSYETPLPEPNNVRSNVDLSPLVPPPPPPDLHQFTDPHLWPESRKNLLLLLSCVATALTAYSSGAFSPPSERMATAFGLSQTGVLACGITVFCIGFALAPMLLAPLSEYNGRYPVFAVSGVIFVVFITACGAAPEIASMSIFRLFVGVGGSVFSTMIGGVIADMWHAEGRNRPMAIFSGAVLAGTGLGPFISSIITYRTTAPHRPSDIATDPGLRAPWRWVFWHQAIMNAVFMAVLVALFKESRGSVLLSRKARLLNRWYEAREAAGYFGVFAVESDESTGDSMAVEGKESTKVNEAVGEKDEEAVDNWGRPLQGGRVARRPRLACRRIRWVVKDDEGRTSVLHMMAMSLYRPFHMLFTEPVVFFFSLWVAFSWAILYLTFGSTFFVFSRTYGWNMEKCGRVFLAMVAASALATVMGLTQDRMLVRLAPRWLLARLRFDVPEQRLYASCVTSILLPAGLFIFGFGARPSVHWFVPTFGIALATMGIYSIYLSTFNYLADVYHRFASSALAAQSCCRNLLGGVFPLVMRPLFANLGNGRAGALLGGIAMGLTLVPWVLVFFGETIRKRSRFAMSLEHT